MKKAIVLLTVFSVLILAISGCSSTPQTTASSTTAATSASSTKSTSATTAATTAAGKADIVVWHYFSGAIPGDVFNEFIRKFNAANTAVHLFGEFFPRADLNKKYMVGSAAKELPDIAMIDNPDQASYSAMGLFEDITDRFAAWPENKLLEGPLSSCYYNGRLYGVPHGSNCLGLWYDADMLAEAGVTPPVTWNELRETAKKLTIPGKRFGLGISCTLNEGGTFQFSPLFLSTGATYTTIGSVEGIKSVQFLLDLVKDGSISSDCINQSQSDVQKQFFAGNVAMCINGSWMDAMLATSAPNKKVKAALISKDKEFASSLGGENFALVKGKNVNAGWTFLTWFLSKDVNILYNQKIGRFSPRSDVTAVQMYPDNKNMQIFAEQLTYAKARGPHPKWPEISVAIMTAVQEALTEAKSPEQACKDAQTKIDAIK